MEFQAPTTVSLDETNSSLVKLNAGVSSSNQVTPMRPSRCHGEGQKDLQGIEAGAVRARLVIISGYGECAVSQDLFVWGLLSGPAQDRKRRHTHRTRRRSWHCRTSCT